MTSRGDTYACLGTYSFLNRGICEITSSINRLLTRSVDGMDFEEMASVILDISKLFQHHFSIGVRYRSDMGLFMEKVDTN